MKKAFTLIELLVVIAIIAILAAILFPVLSQARQAAKKIVGLTQAKQIGLGAQIYLIDADDKFSHIGRQLLTPHIQNVLLVPEPTAIQRLAQTLDHSLFGTRFLLPISRAPIFSRAPVVQAHGLTKS